MADEESETSPPTPDAADGTPVTRCEHCGTAIDTSDWYPVASERDDGGSVRLYDFCDETCQAAWRDERSD